MSEQMNLGEKLCSVELDRVTAAEICIDELLTIMDRHRDRGPMYDALRLMSRRIDVMLIMADGPENRRERLIRVRAALTRAFPMTDEDLEDGRGGVGGSKQP